METFIAERDAEGLRAFIAKASAGNQSEGSILEGLAECQLRHKAMELVREGARLDEIRSHVNFVVELSKSGPIAKTQSVVVIQDMMDVSPLAQCKELFSIVEEMVGVLRQPPLLESIQVNVLRMCNDLLKRLSRTVETSFCGRILSFLSRFLPLMEKSGLNLVGQFNTQNTTKYDTGETEFSDLLATHDDSMETGEIEDTKESLIAVDSKFYQTFWKMQAFFANPSMCFDSRHFSTFKAALGDITTTLASHKLEKFAYHKNNKSLTSKTVEELHHETEKYFAKYLTSTKLLQLQLNDSQFRRNFLVQVLIIIQYLTSDTKKVKTQDLTEEQTKTVLDYQEKCFKLLKDTHPKGYYFVDDIKVILAREKEWSEWKNQGCYEMTRHVDKTPMLVYRKRPRTEFDPKVIDMGSAELTKLWSIEPDMKRACKNPARKFIPTVQQFIADPLDELDPEQQVEDAYKSIYNTAFQWRASRFLMTEAEAFWTVKNDASSKDITEDIAAFMAKVICTAGGKMDYLRPPPPARSETERTENNNDPARSPDSRVTTDTVDQLATIVSKENSLDGLIGSLFPEFEKKMDEVESEAVKRLMHQFAESKNFSVPQMANAFLAAQLISEEVTNVLTPTKAARSTVASTPTTTTPEVPV